MSGPLRQSGDDFHRVVVDTFMELAPANIARGLLEARGIAATLQGDQLIGIAWHLSNAVGGIKLLVPAGQGDEARSILARSLAENALPGDADDADARESSADGPRGPGDALAESAWKASLLGLLIAPPLLNLWSVHLLRQMRFAGGARTARGKTVAGRAAIANFLVLCAAGAVALRWMFERG